MRSLLLVGLTAVVVSGCSQVAGSGPGNSQVQLSQSELDKLADDLRGDWRTSRQAMASLVKVGRPAVPIFVAELNSDNPNTRLVASKGLAELGDQAAAAVAAVTEALGKYEATNGSARHMRYALCDVLVAAGAKGHGAIPVIKSYVGDIFVGCPMGERIYYAAESLAKMGEPGLDALIVCANDESKDTRVGAVHGLGMVGSKDPRVLEKLLHCADDSAPRVRATAIRSLARVASRSERVSQAILRAMADQDVTVRRAAADVAMKVDEGALRKKLKVLLQAKEHKVQVSAAEALAHAKAADEETIRVLIALLKSADEMVRRQAANVLGEIGVSAGKAIPAMIEALDDQNEWVRTNMVRSLALVGKKSPQTANAVRGALNDPSKNVRRAAMNSFWDLRDVAHEAIPDLIRIIESTDDAEERSCAANAIGAFGFDAKDAVPALVTMLEERDKEKTGLTFFSGGTHGAAQSLGLIGPDAIAGVPVLIEVLKESRGSHFNSSRVKQSLEQILGRRRGEQIEQLSSQLNAEDEAVRQKAVQELDAIAAAAKQGLGGAAISGMVRDPAGNPVKDARLTIGGSPELHAKSDAKGAYRFSGLTSDHERVMIVTHRRRQIAAMVRLPAHRNRGVQTVDVILSPMASVEGKVVDETGTPVGNAKVELTQTIWLVPGRMTTSLPQEEVPTTADGVFKHSMLIPGLECSLSVAAKGFADSKYSREFIAKTGVEHHSGPIVLQRAGNTLAGIVVDLDGKPVPDVQINARSQQWSASIPDLDFSRTTGADGRFRYGNVPKVAIRLKAYLSRENDDNKEDDSIRAEVNTFGGREDVRIVMPMRLAPEP